MADPEANLRAAERVAELLAQNHVPAVVIGAVALAAHRYIRFTEDIDLGVDADLSTMRKLEIALRDVGFSVELREPDSEDPLGGVLDVSGPFGLVQVISFADRFPAVIRDAVAAATIRVRPGSILSLVPLPQLVALKLYAGGSKSRADVVELLRRNPEADLSAIQEVCQGYRLGGLETILDELRS